MGRPKKVISDEERRARALERKQAQRERARQQTIRTALSQADQVQILSFPGSALPEPSTSIPEIPSVNVGLIDAVHNDTSISGIARNEREAAGEQNPGPSTAATLDQATSDTGPRYRLRLRSSKSPTPTRSRGAEALQTDRSDAQSGRVVAEEAGQSQALQSHFALPMRPQRCMPPTVTEPASIDRTRGADDDGASVSSFDVDISNDSGRGHKQQSPSDASRTTRSCSAPGDGPGDDDEAVAGASHDVEPPSFRDIVENNGAGRTSTQTAGPHSTEATLSLDNDSPLANAIRAITSGETPAGLAFIEAQAATYRTIFERAFPLVCPCSEHDSSGPQTSPDYFFSANELSNWLRRDEALGDLNAILDPKQPPSVRNDNHMRPQEWERFLSDAPRKLSLQRTESMLPANGIEIERVWDADSVWLGAKSLGAVGHNAVLRLSIIPPFTQSISGEQVAQPHGVNLAHTRHTYLGFFALGGLSFSVFVFFPKTQGLKRSKKSYKGSKPPPFTLSSERQEDFVDGALLPALRATVPARFRQEVPSTYKIAYARRMSFQEKPATARWRSEDESRARNLRYDIRGRFLESFWDDLCQRCNGLLVQPQDSSQAPFRYFAQPKLLFQVHGTKNVLAGETVAEVLDMFCEQVLSGLRAEYLDFRSCWVDIGFRDMPSSYTSSSTHRDGAVDSHDVPVTLLWKAKCHEHYNAVIRNASAPDMGLRPERFRTYNLRDVAGFKAKARSSRVVSSPLDPGNPNCTKLGVACAKAYHCSKEELAVIERDYQIFSSEHLPALTLPESMIQQLFSAGHNTARAVCGAPSRQSLQQAWDANKRHLHAVQSNQSSLNCYAVRKEITLRLDVILWMHSNGAFVAAPDRPAIGEAIHANLQPRYRSDQHYPFWILPTKEVNDLKVSLACRFIKPLNHIFSLAPQLSDHGGETRIVVYYYTAQLLTRLLLLSLTSERDYSYDNWIWKEHWDVLKKYRGQQVTYRRKGLGLEAAIKSTGVVWLGRTQMDWIHSHLKLASLCQLYIPRSPGHAIWKAQATTQDFSRSIVVSVFLVRSLLQRAHQGRADGRHRWAVELESCAIRLAAQEIARTYQKHLLEKLQQFWRNSVIPAHKAPKALRQSNGNGPESLVSLIGLTKTASNARVITAADVNAIIIEGLSIFEPDGGDVAELRRELGPRPVNLPAWMQLRGIHSRNSRTATMKWTEKVYQVLFNPDEAKTWNQAKFLQVYNCLKAVFNNAKSRLCPTFDESLREVIGGTILVMFNSDKSREVTVNRELAPLPTFFRIQFWAPAWDFKTLPTDQPPQLNDRLAAKELFSCLSPTYYDQRSQVDGLRQFRAVLPTRTQLLQAVHHGDEAKARALKRQTKYVYKILSLLFITVKNHPFPRDAKKITYEQPWWFKKPAMDRLLVPVENEGVAGLALPTLVYPTTENFQWIISLSRRLLCVRPVIEAELGDRLPTIDIHEWVVTLDDLRKLSSKVIGLMGSSKALIMPEVLESELAHGFLTSGEENLDEQDSVLLSFLMMTQPPQEELVQDSEVGENEREGADEEQ